MALPVAVPVPLTLTLTGCAIHSDGQKLDGTESVHKLGTLPLNHLSLSIATVSSFQFALLTLHC